MSGTPQVQLSRRYRFSASHRLHVNRESDQWNLDLFGKCNNPFGHGHNYTLQVTVKGAVDAGTGMVVNLGDLDSYVRREVVERFDLANLNEDPLLQHGTPSTENLAVLVWGLLQAFAAEHAPLCLHRVRVEETNNNAFDFYGDHDAHAERSQKRQPTGKDSQAR